MKKLSFAFFITIFSINLIISQNPIKITESIQEFEVGNRNAFTLLLFEGDEKFIEKEIKDFFKDYKGKISNKKEIIIEDLSVGAISVNPFTANVKIEKLSDSYKLSFYFTVDGSVASSSQNSSTAKEIKNILYQFGINATANAIKLQLEEQKNKLKKQESNYQFLIKEKSDLLEDIENYKKKIEDAKQLIIENDRNQLKQKSDIEKQEIKIKETESKLSNVK